MMNGETYSREIREHLMVDAVLHSLLLEYCYVDGEGAQKCEIFKVYLLQTTI